MVFWGVEVKPGKPFAHKCDVPKPRLHISTATLGYGAATAQSQLQCTVGNRSPVSICSLSPGTRESLQINLEFDEDDDVIFSVVGPRSIHLCGYYVRSGWNTYINDELEPFGVDIINTETESSIFSDDEYDCEDSFINDDDDPEFYSQSPGSTQEKALALERPKGSCRWLLETYQVSEPDDDKTLDGYVILYRNKKDQRGVTNEDNLLSSKDDNVDEDIQTHRGGAEHQDPDLPIKEGQSQDQAYDREGSNVTLPSSEMVHGESRGIKRRKEELIPRGVFSEVDNAVGKDVIIESKASNGKREPDNLSEEKEQNPEQKNEEEVAHPSNDTLPFTNMDPEKSRGMKKKMKELIHKGSISEGDLADTKYDIKFNNTSKDKSEPDHVLLNISEEKNLPREVEPLSIVTLPSSEMVPGKTRGIKKRRKEPMPSGVFSEFDDAVRKDVIIESKASNGKPESDNLLLKLSEENDQNEEQNSEDREVQPPSNDTLPSTKMDAEKTRGTESKVKEVIDKGSISEGDNADSKYDIIINNTWKDKSEPDNVLLNLSEEKKLPREVELPSTEMDPENSRGTKRKKKELSSISEGVNADSQYVEENLLRNGDNSDANQSEDEKINKKKKNCSSQVDVEVNSHDTPQSRKLSNGLIIEVLEKGKEDGKTAVSGKKITVMYISRHANIVNLFGTNIRHLTHTFCLGEGQVIEGWDVGIEGMQVGQRRRLIIPPSMRFLKLENEVPCHFFPFNSWLIYEIILIKVHH